MEDTRNLKSGFTGCGNEDNVEMEVESLGMSVYLEKAVVEASTKSTEVFGRCLETSVRFQELREHQSLVGFVNRVDIPGIEALRFRFKTLIQCFRMLSRGLVPGEKLLSELFRMMDDLIVRRGFDMFGFGEKLVETESKMFLVLRNYFCHSKRVFRDRVECTGGILAEAGGGVDRQTAGVELTRVFSEMNAIRINPLGLAGALEIECNLSDRWSRYSFQERQLLKMFRDVDSEAKLRRFLAFPADASYRALLQEKLMRLSRIQNRVRTVVKERGMHYQAPKVCRPSGGERRPEDSVQVSGPDARTGLEESAAEGGQDTLLPLLSESVLGGISSSGLIIPSRIPDSHARGNSVLEGISQKMSDFWESKSPTIHQYRFQMIIDGVPAEKERMVRERRRRKAQLGRLAVSATKQVVSIQSQKQLNLERKERERLRLLRENDLEAYLELVKETKNRRLQELINQTDRFLLDIGLRVQDQKTAGSEMGYGQASSEGERMLSLSEEHLDTGEPEAGIEETSEFVKIPKTTSVASYYTMAHSVTEHISERPMKLLRGGKLLPYQVIGVEWMLSLYNNKLHGILADEMGLGKTVQTIALLTYLHEHKDNHGPHLVVVPLSTLPNWQKEFEIWSPELKVLCFKGSRYERRSLIYEMRQAKFNVCLTTFDFIIRESGPLQSMQWRHIIVDEGHRLKNSKSKFHVVLADFRSENRLLLTGTPLQNSITELWSLLNFLLPQVFHSVEDFQVWFSKPFSDLPSNEASLELSEEERLFVISRLHSILRPFLLRRVKSDVLQDLPEKKEYIVRMELTPWQKIVYDQIKQKAVHSMDLSSGKIQYRSVSNTIMQLRKIVNHPYLFVEEYLIENDDIFRVSCKFEVLDRMLPKLIRFGHKVLIFCQMTQLMDILGDFLDYRGIEHHRLDGTMTIQERKEKMDEFNSPDSEKLVFVLSTRAGGLGLNLQAADTVIIFDSDWNPHQDLQAQSRAHRMGQKNEVRVLRFVSISGVEELVLKRAQKKLEIDHKIIQAGMFNSTQVEEDEREDRLKELFGKEEYKSYSRVTTPSEINQFLARTDEELKAFEEMDKKTFGRSIYQKIQDWSKGILSKKSTSNAKSVKDERDEGSEQKEEAGGGSSSKDANSTLLEYGQSLSRSPPKPKKPGRKQKSFQGGDSEPQRDGGQEDSACESPETQEVLTLEDSKVYLDYLESSGRIIRMQEVPEWIVRPPNEMNAELGIEDSNSNEIRDLERSERKSRWKSNKDYLCVEGLSERAFLRVMEKYEAGEITDITKELQRETNKRRRSLPPISSNSSESSSKRTSLALKEKRNSLRNISTFKSQDRRQERRKTSAYFSSSDSPPTLNESFSEKSASKKRKIISFSEEEEEEEGGEDFEDSDMPRRRSGRHHISSRQKPGTQNCQEEDEDEDGNDNEDDEDYLYSNPKEKNKKKATDSFSTKNKTETSPEDQKNSKTTYLTLKGQQKTASCTNAIKTEKTSSHSKEKESDNTTNAEHEFDLSPNHMNPLPNTPEAIISNS